MRSENKEKGTDRPRRRNSCTFYLCLPCAKGGGGVAAGGIVTKAWNNPSGAARMFFGFAREIVGVQPTKKNSARRIASRTAHPLHRGAENVRHRLLLQNLALRPLTSAGGCRIHEKDAQGVFGMFFGFAREIVGVQPTKKNSPRTVRFADIQSSVFFVDRMAKINPNMEKSTHNGCFSTYI